MTLIAVPILINDPADVGVALEQARLAAAAGATLVEWRLDPIVDQPDAAEVANTLVRESPLPAIVTCRLATEGGHAAVEEQTRIAFFEHVALGEDPPQYIDVELASFRSSANLRQKVRLGVEHPDQVRTATTRLILSSHDFEGRPADLLQRIEAMVEEPACAVAKLVWRARSLRDNLEAFDVLRFRRQPTIALCLGPFGLMSRVLAPKFGGFLTFAAIEHGSESAPGQPTIDELRNLYRFDAIGEATRVYGVIGWPVGHSQGPRIHNAAFTAVGHDGVYLPLPVPPEYEHFKATMGAFLDHPALDFVGASVTLPHKTHLVRFMEARGGEIGRGAAAIGAANTLIVEDGRPRCINTDAPAALACVRDVIDGDLRERTVGILGTGGVARAVAWALADAGARVTVFGRNHERLETLAEDLAESGVEIAAASWSTRGDSRFDVYVNATPLGMQGGPAPDDSPIPADTPLDERVVVLDTVYTPRETPLIKQAREAGAKVITGDLMFHHQAALQFRAWTGQAFPA